MATEKRLIDANIAEGSCSGAEKIISSESTCDYDRGWADALGSVANMIKRMPTVDAVEVVRCKDCTQWMYEYDDVGLCVTDVPDIDGVQRRACDFCSYGERKIHEV